MKLIKTYLLHITALLLCGSLASCEQVVNLTDEDDKLPPGSYPLEFVASVAGVQSRSVSKDAWIDGDTIGVRLINKSGKKHNILGQYLLSKEGTVMDVGGRYAVRINDELSEEWIYEDSEPLEWPYVSGTVTAWFPFKPQTDIDISDQSGGIYAYDYLSATAPGRKYYDVVDLEFKHQMAKVTCRVIPDDGITPEEFETLWLKLQGHTSCTFRETELKGGENIGWITPDSTFNYPDGSIYEALLVPNEMTGKDLISIGLKTNYEGNIIPKHFSYPSPKIEAGMHYIYNITVKKDRIVVSFFSGEWNDDGAGQHEPTRFTFRVNLTDELVNLINISKNGANVINTNLVRLSDNVTPILNTETQLYDKFDVLGNEFTLSIGANTETRSKSLVLVKNEAVNNPRVVNQSGIGSYDTYVENTVFMIADETTLGYKDELNVGDYFFNDGSWSSVLGWRDVQCVGIVFAVNNGDDPSVFKLTDANRNEYVADKAADYTNNPIQQSNRIRGYVLAMEDVEREDILDYTKRLESGKSYGAGTLEYDAKVVVEKTEKTFYFGTEYPGGTLPYDLKAVNIYNDDTIKYKKGTVYPAGKLGNTIKVKIDPQTYQYPKGTPYPALKPIANITVTYYDYHMIVKEFPWSPLDGASAFIGVVCSFDTDLFDGFANLVSVKEKVGSQCNGTQEVPPFDKLEAFAAAEAYPVEAPAGTSGWYLPSIKQLQTALDYFHQYDNNKSESPIMKAAGIFPNERYWSSTIGYRSGTTGPGFNAYTFDYNNPANPLSEAQIVHSSTYRVRAILTF